MGVHTPIDIELEYQPSKGGGIARPHCFAFVHMFVRDSHLTQQSARDVLTWCPVSMMFDSGAKTSLLPRPSSINNLPKHWLSTKSQFSIKGITGHEARSPLLDVAFCVVSTSYAFNAKVGVMPDTHFDLKRWMKRILKNGGRRPTNKLDSGVLSLHDLTLVFDIAILVDKKKRIMRLTPRVTSLIVALGHKPH